MNLDNGDRNYLNDIVERINRIETYTKSGREAFLESELLQDAIIRNFEVMGEATKRLSTELRQTYPNIPWRKIAGFRDVLIHDYLDVEVTEIWNTIVNSLPTFKEQLLKILHGNSN